MNIWNIIFCGCLLALLAASSVHCRDERRLLLHSGDDIASEFQMLRQEMETMKTKYDNEIAMLTANYSQEISALKSSQSQEISALKSSQSQEISALKSSQSQEISALKSNQTQEIAALKSSYTQEMTDLKSKLSERGSTYIRWGRTTCSGNDSVKVYSGYTGGSPHDVSGGAASFVCLPEHPTWAKYVDGVQDYGGRISGTEYEEYNSFQPFPQNMHNEDAPCVLCHTPRSSTVMIPGRTDCYPNWTLEYTGYLMTGHYTEHAATDYACVDVNAEAELHGEANQNGKLLYFTEVTCGSLPCQEYPNGRELACVVCSK